jgi:hypothetical protein
MYMRPLFGRFTGHGAGNGAWRSVRGERTMLGLYRRSQAGSWVVLRGPMRVVFFVGLSLAIANVAFMLATGLRHYHASFSA